MFQILLQIRIAKAVFAKYENPSPISRNIATILPVPVELYNFLIFLFNFFAITPFAKEKHYIIFLLIPLPLQRISMKTNVATVLPVEAWTPSLPPSLSMEKVHRLAGR